MITVAKVKKWAREAAHDLPPAAIAASLLFTKTEFEAWVVVVVFLCAAAISVYANQKDESLSHWWESSWKEWEKRN